jgi:F-type H+-transporting ATPase subunit b
MKRAALIVALGIGISACAFSQEASAKTEQAKTGQEDPMTGWKWANFLILAVGLGYLIGKNVPPLFQKQSEEIKSALAEAAKLKEEAARYASSVEARLANLKGEIERLRADAHSEMASEGERIRRETERHLQRINEQAVQEVALMTRAAKTELRNFASELAIGMAEQDIRSRMTPATQDQLVGGFLADLRDRVAPQAASN